MGFLQKIKANSNYLTKHQDIIDDLHREYGTEGVLEMLISSLESFRAIGGDDEYSRNIEHDLQALKKLKNEIKWK